MGGSGRLYTCFVSCHYCPCPAFAYTVLRRNEGPLVSLKQTVTHSFCILKPNAFCSDLYTSVLL